MSLSSFFGSIYRGCICFRFSTNSSFKFLGWLAFFYPFNFFLSLSFKSFKSLFFFTFLIIFITFPSLSLISSYKNCFFLSSFPSPSQASKSPLFFIFRFFFLVPSADNASSSTFSSCSLSRLYLASIIFLYFSAYASYLCFSRSKA